MRAEDIEEQSARSSVSFMTHGSLMFSAVRYEVFCHEGACRAGSSFLRRSIAFPCYKVVPIVWKNITNATQSDGGGRTWQEKRTPLSRCFLRMAECADRG